MIKKRHCLLALLIILSGFWFGSNHIVLADSQEIIQDFQAVITINQDSSVKIEETINYDFGLNQKHGIIRYVPFRYQLEDKTLVLNYQLVSVEDEKGNSLEYSLGEENNNFVVKIGSANKLVSGPKTYVITYIIQGALNYFDNHDELFWNVTGNEWAVSIKHTRAIIVLNNNFFVGLPLENFQAACYTGVLNSKDQNCQINKSFSGSEEIIISIESYNLNPKEGLTIVVGWPKGFVQEIEKQYITKSANTLFTKFLFVLRYILFFFPIVVFICLFYLWWRNGRNPRAMRSIMAEYEAPANICPAEAHIIMTEGSIDLGKMATATLIDLARRGYFIIKEETEKKLIFKSRDWNFIKTHKENPEDKLNGYEKYLLDSIFEGKEEVNLSSLKHTISASTQNKLRKGLEEAKISLGNMLVDKKLFSENPFALVKKMKTWQIITSICFLLVGFFVIIGLTETGRFGFDFFILLIGFFAIMIIFAVFTKIMPSLTQKGMETKEKLEGFELFLKTVERDRVKFHFSPEAHPEKFADYLPYAILFGVEKQWAKLFENINAAVPQWYEGEQGTGINSVYLASQIANLNSGIQSSFLGAGSAASGGSSGFGSEGSSGGGFGGGGGSSW